jgi:alpha-1,2-mannosyltransferase
MSASGARERVRGHLESRTVRGVLWVALIAATVVCAVQVYRRASRPIGNDLASYLLSSAALWAGQDPYATPTVFPYIYPLFLAFVLRPLGLVPPLVAQAAWFVLGAGALWLAQHLFIGRAAAEMPWERGRGLGGAVALLALFLLDPIQINLVNGQVNFVVLGLVALFLRQHLSGRWIAAGLLLGAATAIKLVPAVLLVFLAVRGAFGTMALALVSATTLCLLPYLCAGSRLWAYYERYLHTFVLARAQGAGVPGHDILFSLGGTAAALWPGVPRVAVHAVSIALVLGPAAWVAHRHRGPRAATWAFALFLLAIPLLTPMSEVHHLALLFPAAVGTTLALLYRSDTVDAVGAALVAAGWIFFWLGRLDRPGPYYLISLVAFYLATLREAPRGPQRPNA